MPRTECGSIVPVLVVEYGLKPVVGGTGDAFWWTAVVGLTSSFTRCARLAPPPDSARLPSSVILLVSMVVDTIGCYWDTFYADCFLNDKFVFNLRDITIFR
jgi:hypothetical protein